MPNSPPTIGQRDPRRQARTDQNGTRAILQSSRYQRWGERLAKRAGSICELCWAMDGRAVRYAHKHHIMPRKHYPELVMDPSNIMLLCHDHHDYVHSTGVNHAKPLDCIAVCGPPCSGKSTYVRNHARPSDVVWDWDAHATTLGLTRSDKPTPRQWHQLEQARRDAIKRAQDEGHRLWLIASNPRSKVVKDAADRIVAMRTTEAECLDRLDQRTIEENLSHDARERTMQVIREAFA